MFDPRDYFEDLDKNPQKYKDRAGIVRLEKLYGYVWSKDNIGWDVDNCIPDVNRWRYEREMKEL